METAAVAVAGSAASQQPPTPQQLQQAVAALYSNPDPAAKAEANRWLNALQSSPIAWSVAAESLTLTSAASAAAAELRYFCANLVLAKVHAEWAHTPPEIQLNIAQLFLSLAAGYLREEGGPQRESPLVISRVCMVVAAIAVRTSTLPQQQAATVSQILTLQQLVERATQVPSQQVGESALAAAVALLQAVAEEAANADRVTTRRLLPVMRTLFHHTASFVQSVANQALSQQQQQQQQEKLNPVAQGSASTAIITSLLQLLQSWVHLDFSAEGLQGVTASHIRSSFPMLWLVLLALLGGGGSLACLPAAADVLALLLRSAALDEEEEMEGEGEGGGAGVGGSGRRDLAEEIAKALVQSYRGLLSGQAMGPVVIGSERRDVSGVWEEGDATTAAKRSLCEVAVALAEFSPRCVGGVRASAEGRAVVAMALDVAHGMHDADDLESVMDLVVELFAALSALPLAHRSEEMRGASYERLVQLLLDKAMFPGDTGGRLDDADAFHRFRDYVVAEGVLLACPLLKSGFYAIVRECYETSTTWQQAEAAMFTLRCAAAEVKRRLVDVDPTTYDEEKLRSVTHIATVFSALASDGQSGRAPFAFVARADTAGGGGRATPAMLPLPSHPLLVKTVVETVGAFGGWLALQPECLPGVLTLVLRALQVEEAEAAAADAFKQVCARCAFRLNSQQTAEGLIAAAETSVMCDPSGPNGQSLAHLAAQEAVTEGLARVVSALAVPVAQPLATRLVVPHLLAARDIAQSAVTAAAGAEGPPVAAVAALAPEQRCEALAGQVRVATAAVRFLEFDSSSLKIPPGSMPSEEQQQHEHHLHQHPCVPLLEVALPIADAIIHDRRSSVWRESSAVVAAVADMHCRLLQSVKQQFVAAGACGRVVEMHARLFQTYRHPCCVEFLAHSVEALAAVGADTAVLTPALDMVTSTCVESMNAGLCDTQPEVFSAYFDLLNRALLFAPALVASSGCMGPALRMACRVIAKQERESSRSTLTAVAHALSPGARALTLEPWHRLQSAVAEELNAMGHELVAALLLAVADVLPRDLVRAAANVVYQLLVQHDSSNCPAAAVASATGPGQGQRRAPDWLLAALQLPLLQQIAASRMTGDEVRGFSAAVLSQPPLPKAKFAALVADFSAVCRGEGTADLLLAYHL